VEDDNIFDEDDALDCILFEEHSGEPKKKDNNAGCLSLIVVATIPLSSCLFFISEYFS
jgi:hypothetical protein